MLSTAAAALAEHLNSMPDCPDVAWEDYPFEPTQGEIYLSEVLSPNEPMPLMLEGGYAEYTGIYGVNVYYPKGKTKFPSIRMQEKVKEHFERGTVLVKDGLEITIHKVELKQPVMGDGAFNFRPVIIYYRYYG